MSGGGRFGDWRRLAWLDAAPEQSAIGWMAGAAAAVHPGAVHAMAALQASPWIALLLCCGLLAAALPRWKTARYGEFLAGSSAVAAGVGIVMLAGLGRHAAASTAGDGPQWLTRLHDFLLSAAPGPSLEPTSLDRFAGITCLVLALMGCAVAWRRWPRLWPTYGIVAAVAVLTVWGVIPSGSRALVEPIALVWASLAVAPPLMRLFPSRQVRVYRPGERAEDPFGREHVLRGPHYDATVRRRAG